MTDTDWDQLMAEAEDSLAKTRACGAYTCAECYPFTYRCPDCGTDYPTPVPNGTDPPTCEYCGEYE